MGFPESLPDESAESVGAKGFGETAAEGSVGSDVSGRSAPLLSILDASTVNGSESVPNLSILNASTKDLEASAMSQEREISLVNEDHSEFSIPVTVDSAAVDQVILDGVYGLSISIMADETGESSPDEDISGQTPATGVRSCESTRSSTNLGVSEGTSKASYNTDQNIQNTLELRGYQQEVAQNVLRGENDIVILPTGTGKTYVAIHIILNHIEKRLAGSNNKRCKIVFLVPNATLATQQLGRIKYFVSPTIANVCAKITGEDDVPLEEVKCHIKDDVHKVLVVTSAIINNYFKGSEDASMMDFTLLIFDECHHAKKGHEYNVLLQRYYQAFVQASNNQSCHLPQLMGMTASLGVGDSEDGANALDFMLSMCARFHINASPIAVKENLQELQDVMNNPVESIEYVGGRKNSCFTDYIENKIMSSLENSINDKVGKQHLTVENSLLKQFKFPIDRHQQSYEQFVTAKKETMCRISVSETTMADVNYITLALRHLLVYYRALELVSLLQCKHGMGYLVKALSGPEYLGRNEIINLWQDNRDELKTMQEEADQTEDNPKLFKLQATLKALFSSNPDSKVIIFVQRRVVAYYIAKWLCSLSPETYCARKFTSAGPSKRDGGMKTCAQKDATVGFGGRKYNILVSTSLLEEGIDMPACNMVICYMYSKDAIGKIQARGRARAKDGQIVYIADIKLGEQKKRNDCIEKLMCDTLSTLQGLSAEEFSKSVTLKTNSLLFPKDKELPRKQLSKAGVIKCMLCKSVLGNIQDIKCYLGNHHLVLDSSISDKVAVEPEETEMKGRDGIELHSQLLCSAKTADGKLCNNEVGTLIRMRSTGCCFGVWKIKQIQAEKPYKSYKDMKKDYEIENICIEKLQGLAPNKQFPPDKVQ